MNKAILQQPLNHQVTGESANVSDIASQLAQCQNFQHLVICGLPKCGTTLPLTLLDGHPELAVFPEELRFMDSGCQNMQNSDALVKLLHNHNTRQLQADVAWLDDYREHLGTGYGLRDYSNLEFSRFSSTLKQTFELANTPEQRYLGCFLALETAKGNPETLLKKKPMLVSKSPNNELFMFSFERMLGERLKFLWCIRNPFEHFLSIRNIAGKLGQRPMQAEPFCQWVKGRMGLLPAESEQLFVLRYEDLVSNTESTMKLLARFLGIQFQSSLLQPTKNGVAWSGNSSRGIIQEGIYNNPDMARESLAASDIKIIESQLGDVLKRFNYQ